MTTCHLPRAWRRYAEQSGADRSAGIGVLRHGRQRRQTFQSVLGEPDRIMPLQCSAIGKPQQGGTVSNLSRNLFRRTDSLIFGDRGKPSTKCFPVRGRIQVEEAGCPLRECSARGCERHKSASQYQDTRQVHPSCGQKIHEFGSAGGTITSDRRAPSSYCRYCECNPVSTRKTRCGSEMQNK